MYSEKFETNEPTMRVQLFPDGKYRWTYELNLWKNLTIFWDLMKVMGITAVGILFLVVISPIFKGHHIRWAKVVMETQTFLWVALAFFILCLIGYVIFAKINGGRQHIMLIMDDEAIIHRLMPREVKNGKLIAAAAVMADPNNIPAAIAASQTEWVSHFNKVRHVKTARRRHLIKVNEILTRNRIYVENPVDYEFVLNHIKERSPRLKTKKKK